MEHTDRAERNESKAEWEGTRYHSEWPHLSTGGSICLLALEQTRGRRVHAADPASVTVWCTVAALGRLT